MSSQEASSSSPDPSTAQSAEDRKPFVEPELHCESDLVGGTGEDRYTFESAGIS